eukprot:CAMPEP_0202889616 /NCGR_PEP_ID=MMETSP1392-20130828/206_1 /ASSEMBLY_ACC=CAM_ASM_000868 /TAXON_ID=225041 /ORGANISM="Chlamydomonas chlamydogama, Strain SAG 11-48b" /LENGTH=103 /DNA_ID=CAMNT_0049572991 /DNA_START=14 /DNA_END=325 /DNA_ORIENTATION=-
MSTLLRPSGQLQPYVSRHMLCTAKRVHISSKFYNTRVVVASQRDEGDNALDEAERSDWRQDIVRQAKAAYVKCKYDPLCIYLLGVSTLLVYWVPALLRRHPTC